MRQCSIYRCPQVNEWRCCADCDQPDCVTRCANHPDRCKCIKGENEGKIGRGKPRAVDPDRVLSLAKAGKSNYSIAIELECSPSWVARLLRNAGYVRPEAKKGGKPDA